MTDNQPSATTLEDAIAEFSKGVAAHVPPELLATIGSELRALAESGIVGRALAVNAKAPDFTLPDAHGTATSLSAVLSGGPAVVAFYRGGWCPFCDLQLRAYERVLPQIHDLGAQLVAISPQTPDYSLSDVEKKGLTFPVLSDVGNHVARQYGLVFSLSETLRKVHQGFGSVLPKFNGDESWELPLAGTFVVDRGGVVRLAYVDADYRKRLEPAAILGALKSLKG